MAEVKTCVPTNGKPRIPRVRTSGAALLTTGEPKSTRTGNQNTSPTSHIRHSLDSAHAHGVPAASDVPGHDLDPARE